MDFEKIYSEYFPQVYRYLLSLCHDGSLAEELAQDTFYKLIDKIDSFRGECSLLSWIIGIAKNTYISHVRKQKKTLPLNAEANISDDFNIEQRLIEKDSAQAAYRALHNLCEPYKEVFMLRVFSELSFKEIGELFNKTEVWARVTYHRARQKIKEEIS